MTADEVDLLPTSSDASPTAPPAMDEQVARMWSFLSQRSPLSELEEVFLESTGLYRKCIELAQQREAELGTGPIPSPPSVSTAGLAMAALSSFLGAVVGGEGGARRRGSSGALGVAVSAQQFEATTLESGFHPITELEMVDKVFTPLLESATPGFPFLQPTQGTGDEYLMSALLLYVQSLLRVMIYPHRRVQIFLVQVCAHLRHLSLLQQLLHYHVILDSPDVCDLLHSLGTREPWVLQASLDMATRLCMHLRVVEILASPSLANSPLDIIPYLRQSAASATRRVGLPKIRDVFAAVATFRAGESDVDSVLNCVAANARQWAADETGDSAVMDMVNCEEWMGHGETLA